MEKRKFGILLLRLMVAVFISSTVLAAIILSPLFMAVAVRGSTIDWVTVGNLGQAYGAVSSLFTGLALVGVIVNSILQTRQNRLSASLGAREMQFNIFAVGWRDPNLLKCLFNFDASELERARQHSYINLHFMYLRMVTEFGGATYGQLRTHATHVFSTEPGQAYWSEAAPYFHEHYRKRSDKKFVQALDLGYADAALKRNHFFQHRVPTSSAAESSPKETKEHSG